MVAPFLQSERLRVEPAVRGTAGQEEEATSSVSPHGRRQEVTHLQDALASKMPACAFFLFVSVV